MEKKRLFGHVEKGWGHELIWASTDEYCCKFLNFDMAGSRTSMHFHMNKDERWYVQSGRFQVEWIDVNDGSTKSSNLSIGDTWYNYPKLPHRLICIEPGTVVEVSTADSIDDNYRISPGDSQMRDSLLSV
jgi:mannose-6-phosphate isomerase-like protein (cupin superfamily)